MRESTMQYIWKKLPGETFRRYWLVVMPQHIARLLVMIIKAVKWLLTILFNWATRKSVCLQGNPMQQQGTTDQKGLFSVALNWGLIYRRIGLFIVGLIPKAEGLLASCFSLAAKDRKSTRLNSSH